MAIFVGGYNAAPFDQNSIEAGQGRTLRTLHRLVLSGNYTTGGDTLDFTNAGVSSAVPTPQSRGLLAARVYSNGPAGSVGANGGNYEFIPGTTLANGKLKIFATAGVEYANGAYGANATSDVVFVEATWGR